MTRTEYWTRESKAYGFYLSPLFDVFPVLESQAGALKQVGNYFTSYELAKATAVTLRRVLVEIHDDNRESGGV